MALNQTNKLVWVVKTIREAGLISFEDLNEKWLSKDNMDLSGGEELLKRTFHKWKSNILDTFGLLIECEKKAPYRYYIANPEQIEGSSIEKWIISTYSVSNSLIGSKSIKERILIEEVPSGLKYLQPAIDAMKDNHMVRFVYHNYWRDDDREHLVMPLCVKLFHQRWYLVGRSATDDNTAIYCLDRFVDFKTEEQTFQYPGDFDPKEYFASCFGIVKIDDLATEHVKLKVAASQAKYLRALRMHASQQEAESNDEYSIFTFTLQPAYDFQQELLWHGDTVEVLEPQWLRDAMAERIKRMYDRYFAPDK